MFSLNGFAVFLKHKPILVSPTESELQYLSTSFIDTAKRYYKNLCVYDLFSPSTSSISS